MANAIFSKCFLPQSPPNYFCTSLFRGCSVMVAKTFVFWLSRDWLQTTYLLTNIWGLYLHNSCSIVHTIMLRYWRCRHVERSSLYFSVRIFKSTLYLTSYILHLKIWINAVPYVPRQANRSDNAKYKMMRRSAEGQRLCMLRYCQIDFSWRAAPRNPTIDVAIQIPPMSCLWLLNVEFGMQKIELSRRNAILDFGVVGRRWLNWL